MVDTVSLLYQGILGKWQNSRVPRLTRLDNPVTSLPGGGRQIYFASDSLERGCVGLQLRQLQLTARKIQSADVRIMAEPPSTQTAMPTARLPVPPFTAETARQKVKAAQDVWNTK